ncbi:phage regulatory CII family protein [Amorphus sp. MBR-141]
MNIDARALSVVEYKALKDASRRLVEENGGLDASAERTRISPSQLQRCTSNFHDSFLTIDVVMDLERSCGMAPVTERLSRLQGHVLQRCPQHGREDANWIDYLTTFIREGGDVEIGLAEAMADGEVDATEAAALIEEIHQAERALARMRSALTAVVMKGD